MPQFAAHKNTNPTTRRTYPFLLDIQSDLLSELQTRVVVPLAERRAVSGAAVENLMPLVEVGGKTYIAMVPQLAGVARAELGAVVETCEASRQDVVAALDFLITGI